MQRRALGKGLKALIPVTDEKSGGAFEIAAEDVRPNRYQPRKIFNDLKLTELVNSIREKGVVQPIIVQKSDNGYELIAGERRWRAAQKAGLNKIPAIIKEVSSEESLDCGDPPKILLCLFARPENTWAEVFEKESAALRTYLPEKNLDIQLANSATFAEQVRWADVIYIRGGITDMLIEILQRSPEWVSDLDGKTLAGSSAGADATATHHYNLDKQAVGSGLGLLPIKVIPHWRSDYGDGIINWDQAYADLKAYGEELPIIPLAEGQFEVINT